MRIASPQDEAFLYTLFAYDKAADLSSAGLPDPQIETLVALQYRARAMSYASAFPDARSWIAERAGTPAARLLEAVSDGGRYVIDIAVAPGHRRQGFAQGLLDWLKRDATAHGQDVSARIYHQNGPSRALFTKLGFQERFDPDDPQVKAIWRRDEAV